jgi:hypothetical protein
MSVKAETFELGFVPMLAKSNADELGIKQGIDEEKGVIFGAQVVAKGETSDERFMIDDNFLNRVVEVGNAEPGGVRMNLGHPEFPGQDKLMTFLGVRENFVREGNGVFADMNFSSGANEQAKKLIFAMAREHPEKLGSSLVFKGKLKNVSDDMPPVPILSTMPSVDVVDIPAAGTGMFSEQKQLLDGEQDKKEVNSMTEEVKEKLAAKEAELLQEQLNARDAELTAANEKIAMLEKNAAITETKVKVEKALSASELPDGGKEKVRQMFKDAESCDNIEDEILAMSEFIQSVQIQDKPKEKGAKVEGMGINATAKAALSEADDQEKRVKAYMSENPDASLSDAYKATFRMEEN